MTKIDKLTEKIKRNPPFMRFDLIKKFLEYHGYYLDQVHGSHFKFTKDGCYPLIIPVHNNQVKRAYIIRLRKRLNI